MGSKAGAALVDMAPRARTGSLPSHNPVLSESLPSHSPVLSESSARTLGLLPWTFSRQFSLACDWTVFQACGALQCLLLLCKPPGLFPAALPVSALFPMQPPLLQAAEPPVLPPVSEQACTPGATPSPVLSPGLSSVMELWHSLTICPQGLASSPAGGPDPESLHISSWPALLAILSHVEI